MRREFKHAICCISLICCCLVFTGCGNSSSTLSSSEDTAVTASQDSLSAKEDDVSQDTNVELESETKKLTITITNLCDFDIGMVAVIDPATAEQVNLDSLASGESISMEATWPSTAKEFQWALYNADGELCTESKTDISAALTSVTLVLSGSNTVENIEEEIR